MDIRNELKSARHNLVNGARLIFFKRLSLDDFHVSVDQLVFLGILFSGLIFVGSYFISLPNPEFSYFGLSAVATEIFFLGLCGYLFAKISKDKGHALTLSIILLSTWLLVHVFWLLWAQSATFNYWNVYGKHRLSYSVLNIWIAIALVVAVSRLTLLTSARKVGVFVVYVLVVAIPVNSLVFGGFWYQGFKPEEATLSINQEDTYYHQFELIDALKKALLPQRDNVSDMYFVGFGSYASQDVFMKEVRYIRGVLDTRFDTQGRSVALINNSKTLDDIPLASKSNLDLVLKHIGSLMNTEEDILFLYLTSHGSKSHKLSVDQTPLNLNAFGPDELKASLDASGIKYRVVLVSACYSGGFLDPLKNDNTLVFTASSKTRTSFGCSNESDFTYFGKAVFQENLTKEFDMVKAFNNAIESIKARESKERLKSSNPQLYVGTSIRDKLSVFSREIVAHNLHIQ